ncbi:MAG: hypothetical protein ACP5SH_23205, partial [Syntrophobacteraceae bacterium]
MDNSISIKREDFLAMLKPLKHFAKKKQAADAVLSMKGRDFVISFDGISTGGPAIGNWAGQVCVPARLIWGIAMAPPPGDPIRMDVRDGRLHIGSLSLSCSVQSNSDPAESKSLETSPIVPELVKMLRFRYLYSPEELQKGGFYTVSSKLPEKQRFNSLDRI